MDGTVITKNGMRLLTKLIAAKSVLNFTRVEIGTGILPKGFDPASMVGLVQYKMNGMITRCKAEDDIAQLTMQVSSAGVETGFTMTELGVYAEDPDKGEILYAYLDMADDPQYIYAEGGEAQKFLDITLDIAIDGATKITAFINPNGMVTIEMFEEGMETKSGIVVMKEHIPVSERRHNTWYLNVTDTQSYRAVKTNRALGFRIIGEEDTICQT